MEDFIRYGSKVREIRFLAIDYFLGLLERGELPADAPPAKEALAHIVATVGDKDHDVVVRSKRLLGTI